MASRLKKSNGRVNFLSALSFKGDGGSGEKKLLYRLFVFCRAVSLYHWLGQEQHSFCTCVSVCSHYSLCAFKRYQKHIALCFVSFLIAVGVNTAYTHIFYDKLTALDGKTVTVKGEITDISYIGSDTCRLSVNGTVGGVKGRLTFYADDLDYDYYDNIVATVKVSRIKDSINFKSEQYERPKGVFLQGSTAESIEVTGGGNTILRSIMHYRDKMFMLINDIIGGDEGGFAAAMLCGDKTELSKQTKLTVYRSGIGHIFSVSGTHVVIISAMIGWLMQKLSKDKRVIFAVQTVAMWAFAVFAGFSVSVVRAAVMLTLVTAAPLLYRRPDPANTLCLCAVILLTLSPYAAADCSFLLSFTATFVIGTVCPKAAALVKGKGILYSLERQAVNAVTILFCTMPVQLMFFSEISLVAPLSNILLVPVCTLALGLTVITAVTGGAAIIAYPVLTVVKYLLKVVLFLAELFSKFSFAYLPRGVRPLGIVMLVTCLVPVAVMFLRKSVKLGAFCTALMLVCWTAVYNFSLAFGGSVKIVVMPKGNAVQAVLYDKTKGMVFDIGSKGKLNSGMESFLELYGIKELKGAFIESEQYYTITKYNEQMTIRPDRFYINGEPDNDSELPFMTGAQLDWNGVKIEALEDGYKITTEGCVVTIEKGSVTINGRNLDTTDEEYPLMIDMKNSQIRRTDYGFAYGFGSW